jgi:hypothetical protein
MFAPGFSLPVYPLHVLCRPVFYNISFDHAEEDYMEERKCCDEKDILEERGSAGGREGER